MSMYKVEITTNRHWRAFKHEDDVPQESTGLVRLAG